MARFVPVPGLDALIAERIGRPAVTRIAAAVRDAAQRAAPPVHLWVTMRDERVRTSHIATDGQAIPGNLRFILPKAGHADYGAGRDLAREPGDPALPIANAINCFPGTATFEQVGRLLAVWRAPYRGALVRLTTSGGHHLTGTPNHPVLTPAGLRPLGSLDEGDHLIYGGAPHAPADRGRALRRAPHVRDRPATIEEVFVAAALRFGMHRAGRAPVDLYGDPLAGEVEVVAVDGQLLRHLEAAGAQRVEDLSLAQPDVLPRGLPHPRLADQLPLTRRLAPAGHVGGLSELAPVLGRGGGHAQGQRLAAASRLDARRQEVPPHRPTGDPETAGDRQLRLPREVAADEVVRVEVGSWWGHVYTCTTSVGHFLADGFVVGNCRCFSVALTGRLAQTIHVTDTTVVGPIARAEVATRFPRAAESEFPSAGDTGGGWMGGAAAQVVATLRARR